MTVLTASAAPIKNNEIIASAKVVLKPNKIVARPKTRTDAKNNFPCLRIFGNCETTNPAPTEPIAWADVSQTNPVLPTSKISRATIGSMVLADAKNVAMKSMSIVEEISGRLKIKRTPNYMKKQKKYMLVNLKICSTRRLIKLKVKLRVY